MLAIEDFFCVIGGAEIKVICWVALVDRFGDEEEDEDNEHSVEASADAIGPIPPEILQLISSYFSYEERRWEWQNAPG